MKCLSPLWLVSSPSLTLWLVQTQHLSHFFGSLTRHWGRLKSEIGWFESRADRNASIGQSEAWVAISGPMRSLGAEDRVTRWRIIAETKSDICQGKYFKVSPKIFHWHLDISPGDQCASLTPDIIPGRQYYHCLKSNERILAYSLTFFHRWSGYLCFWISVMLRGAIISLLRGLLFNQHPHWRP